MAKQLRARMKCVKVEGDTYNSVELRAVYSEDKNDPNYSYSQATPWGELKMSISNPDALGFFEVDKVYDIDITPTEVE